MLKWFDDVDTMLALGKAAPGTNVFPVYSGPFALVADMVNKDFSEGARELVDLASSRIFRAQVGMDNYVVVIVCRVDPSGMPRWAVYCGDKQVEEGGRGARDAEKLAAQLRASSAPVKLANAVEEGKWQSSVKDAGSCAFFRMQARGRLCSHTQSVLANVAPADLAAMPKEIDGWLSNAKDPVGTAAKARSPEEEACLRVAFLKPVLLAGERGSGKTYFARQLADDLDAMYLEIQMHPAMEPWELRTHDRACDGKIYSVMGKLAEAVYWTQQGKKVVLCMDEFLNMNPVYQPVINSPLTLTKDDTYLIETGRVIDMGEGLGRLETVEVPKDMLWVVATTNIGARYGLDKIAPSVRARFRVVLMNTSPDRTKSIVEINLDKFGMPKELAENFRSFIEACNLAVAENTLDEEATTRLACDVIRAAHHNIARTGKKSTTVKQWKAEIKLHLLDEITQVVNFELGPLDPDQAARYTGLVTACFK